MKRILALTLALVMLFTLTACSKENNGEGSSEGNEGGSETSQAKDQLTVKLGPVNSHDPFEAYSSDQYIYLNCIYTTLIRTVYEDGEPISKGNLAVSWDEEDDGAVWVFRLAENATFSDGSPITAEDVKFSFEKAIESPYMVAYIGMIEGIEVRDEHTVAIDVGSFDNSLPWVWSHIYIVNKEAYTSDPASYIKSPISSGHYVLDNLDDATGNITLTCREDCWGETPSIKTVNLRIISSIETALLALEAGELDAMGASETATGQIEKNTSLVLSEHPNNSLGGLFINCQAEPWTNVELRQAVAYAVDYETMRNFLYDGRVDGESTIAFNSTIDPMPEGLNEYSYDIDKAKELIEKSGLSLPIDGGSIIGGTDGAGELLQQYLGAVGINITVLELSGADFVNAIMTGDYSLSFIPGAVANFKASQVIKSAYTTGAGDNYSRYSNERVDEIAGMLAVERDQEEYDKMLFEALSIICEEIPVVGFGQRQYYIGQAKGLYIPPSLNGEIYIADCYWE